MGIGIQAVLREKSDPCIMYSLGAWWWLCFFFVTFSIQTVGVVAAVNKSRDDSGDFDYDSHNPLGHEYESGEDGVERVKCADEFEDMGKPSYI